VLPFTTTTFVAKTPPNRTVAPAWNPVPAIDTAVPPDVGPEEGAIDSIVGAAPARIETTLLAGPEVQPARVSVTCSVRLPAAPAVKVIALPVAVDVIVPPVIVQAYVLPALNGTLADSPTWFGIANAGAVIAGVAGIGLTVMTAFPVPAAEPLAFETVVIV